MSTAAQNALRMCISTLEMHRDMEWSLGFRSHVSHRCAPLHLDDAAQATVRQNTQYTQVPLCFYEDDLKASGQIWSGCCCQWSIQHYLTIVGCLAKAFPFFVLWLHGTVKNKKNIHMIVYPEIAHWNIGEFMPCWCYILQGIYMV